MSLFLPVGQLHLAPLPMPPATTKVGDDDHALPWTVQFEQQFSRVGVDPEHVGEPVWSAIPATFELKWDDSPQTKSTHMFQSEDVRKNRGMPEDVSAVLLAIKTSLRTHTTSDQLSEGNCAIALRPAGARGWSDYVTYAYACRPSLFGQPLGDLTPKQEVFNTVPVMLRDGRFEMRCDIGIKAHIRIIVIARLLGYFAAAPM